MNKITETDIELLAIEELEKLGWQYLYAPQIAYDGEFPERDTYADVVLKERLKSAIAKINPEIPAAALEQAFNEVMRIHTPDLLQTNENFHSLLTEGIKVFPPVNQIMDIFLNHTITERRLERLPLKHTEFDSQKFNKFMPVTLLWGYLFANEVIIDQAFHS